jgi:hypothetical protein
MTVNMLAETLMRSLPWYFGVAVFAVWGGAATALFLLLRRRIKARAARRPISPSVRRPRDDRSLGSGADIEPW